MALHNILNNIEEFNPQNTPLKTNLDYLKSKLVYLDELNKNIFSNLSVGICILDSDLTILTTNRAMEKIFQKEKKLMIGQNFSQVFKDLKESGLEGTIQLVFKSGKPFYLRSCEFKYNSSSRYFNLNLIPQECYENGSRHLILMLEDISYRKSPEKIEREQVQEYSPASLVANYISLLNNTQDIIFTIDISLKITYLSDNFEKITGYSSERFKNQSFLDFITEKDRPNFLQFYQEIKEGMYYELDIDYINKNGDLINCCLNMRLIFCQQDLVGCIGIVKDVTEKKQIISKLVASEKLATLGSFASSIAHEINNPIGIILGFTKNLLKKIDLKDPYYKEVEIIQGEALRCSEIMTSLIDFSSRNIIHKSRCDIRQLINKCLDLLSYDIKKAKVSIIKDFHLDNNTTILMDSYQMQQTITNVLLNAIEAIPQDIKGEIRIKATLDHYQAEARKNYIRLSFFDNGCGILPEDFNRVFDPFFTSKSSEHQGLGLSLAKKIIASHLGIILVESKIKHGTKVSIELPIGEKIENEKLRG
ncbi:MAG: PAS domain S-box protein [bacterium]